MAAKAEQTEIPGTERPRIPAIDRAAAKYETARDARMEATEEEVKQKEKLRDVLHEHEHELTERDEDSNPFYLYQDDGEWKMAVLERSEESVKVKKYKAPKASKDD